MGELGSQSGFSEVNTRLVCSFTSDIPFVPIVEIYEVVPWMERGNQLFSVGKKIEQVSIVGFGYRNFGHLSTSSTLKRIIIGGRRLCSISLMYRKLLMIGIVELPVIRQPYATISPCT